MGRQSIKNSAINLMMVAFAAFLAISLAGFSVQAGPPKSCDTSQYMLNLVGVNTCTMEGSESTVAIYSAMANPICQDISNVNLQFGSKTTMQAADSNLSLAYSIGASKVDVNLNPYNRKVTGGLYGVKVDAAYDTTSFDFAFSFSDGDLDTTTSGYSIKAGRLVAVTNDNVFTTGPKVDLSSSLLGGRVVDTVTNPDGSVTVITDSVVRVSNDSGSSVDASVYIRFGSADYTLDASGYAVTQIDDRSVRLDGSIDATSNGDFTVTAPQGTAIDVMSVPQGAIDVNTCNNFVSGTIDVAGENSLEVDLNAGTPAVISISSGGSVSAAYDIVNLSAIDQTVTITATVTGQAGSVTFDGTAVTATLDGVAISCLPFWDPLNDPNRGSLVCSNVTISAGSRSTLELATPAISVTSREDAVGLVAVTVVSATATATAPDIEVRVASQAISITLEGPSEVRTVSAGAVAINYTVRNNSDQDVELVYTAVEQVASGTIRQDATVDPVLEVNGTAVVCTTTQTSDDVRETSCPVTVTARSEASLSYTVSYTNDSTEEELVMVLTAYAEAQGVREEATAVTVTVATAEVLTIDTDQTEYQLASGEVLAVAIDVTNNSDREQEITFATTASATSGEIRSEDDVPVTVTYENGNQTTLRCTSNDPDPNTGTLTCEPFTLAARSTATLAISTVLENRSSVNEATFTIDTDFTAENVTYPGPTINGTIDPAPIEDLLGITAVSGVPTGPIPSPSDVGIYFELDISSEFANATGSMVFTVDLGSDLLIQQGFAVFDGLNADPDGRLLPWVVNDEACVQSGARQDPGILEIICPLSGLQDRAVALLVLYGVTNTNLSQSANMTIDAVIGLNDVLSALDAPIDITVEMGGADRL